MAISGYYLSYYEFTVTTLMDVTENPPTGAATRDTDFNREKRVYDALESFNSKDPDTPIEHWINKFKLLTKESSVPARRAVIILLMKLKGAPFKTAEQVPECEKGEEYLENILLQLKTTYGSTPAKAFKQLCSTNVMLEQFESVLAYCDAVKVLVRDSFVQLRKEKNLMNEVQKIFFYAGLPQTHPATTSIKPNLLDDTTVDQMAAKVEGSYDLQGVRGTVVATTSTQNNFNPAKRHRGSKQSYCHICRKEGHHTDACRHNSRNGRSEGELEAVVGSRLPILVCPKHKLTMLCDSGSTATIVGAKAARAAFAIQDLKGGMKRGVDKLTDSPIIFRPSQGVEYTTIKTLAGTQTCKTYTAHILGSNTPLQVLVHAQEYPLEVDGQTVDIILGTDAMGLFGKITLHPTRFGMRVSTFDHRHIPEIGEYQRKIGDNNRQICLSYTHSQPKMVCPSCGVTMSTDVSVYPAPPHVPNDEDLLWRPIHDTDPIEVRLTSDDHVLCRRVRPDGTRYWQLKWIWKETPPKMTTRPGIYKGQFDPCTDGQKKMFFEEIDKWIKYKFLTPCARKDLKGNVTIMCVAQEHKESTPVRPVLDFKPLNHYIRCKPNADAHVTVPDTLRKWRAVFAEDENGTCPWYLLDIKKAYLCIYMTPECAEYQGLIINRPDDPRIYWRLDRMGFGLNIAPKILRTVVRYIIQENNLQDHVDGFVDDLRVPAHKLQVLIDALAFNSFPTKPPELVSAARVLGLRLQEDGTWKRRETIKPFPTVTATVRDVRSWCRSVACSHYPVLRWLRPAAASLERLLHMAVPRAKPQDCIPTWLHDLATKLSQDISLKGDPATGKFTVNVKGDWKLYCDASDLGIGCTLVIDGHIVEDMAWLRKPKELKPIDAAELDAVVAGFNRLLLPWLRATNRLYGQQVTVLTDNMPVFGQLTRKQNSHWVSAKGRYAGMAEANLQLIDQLIQTYNLDIDYKYVSSEHNPADCLTRPPSYLNYRKILKTNPNWFIEEGDTQELVNAMATDYEVKDGKLYVPHNQLLTFLKEVHDHEGSDALFHRVKAWVTTDKGGLHAACRKITTECLTCLKGKAQPNQNRPSCMRPSAEAPPYRARVPYNQVHMDIAGNYRTIGGCKSYFVLALVDSASGYAHCLAIKSPPRCTDVVALLTYVIDSVHKSPLVLLTDGGANLIGTEVQEFLATNDIAHRVTPKNSSFVNGRVERFFRVLNEYLRTHTSSVTPPWHVFRRLVAQGTRAANTRPNKGESAHDRIFKFSPVDPSQPSCTRDEFPDLRLKSTDHWEQGFAPGDNVLVRVQRPTNKLAQRWESAVVSERTRNKTYKLENLPGTFHVRDLKHAGRVSP